jgi:hypothetical protein
MTLENSEMKRQLEELVAVKNVLGFDLYSIHD